VRYTLGVHYLYIKRNVEKVWGARYLPENTVFIYNITSALMKMHVPRWWKETREDL
jgi:hypothetical protein